MYMFVYIKYFPSQKRSLMSWYRINIACIKVNIDSIVTIDPSEEVTLSVVFIFSMIVTGSFVVVDAVDAVEGGQT